jgi:cytidylate kinase
MEKKYIISIGRQLGSGGREIAQKLAERLNIPVYDKKLLELAAKETGLDATVFENADEKESNPLMRGIFALKGVMSTYPTGLGSCMDGDRLFEVQSEVMRHLVEKESCIIIGRCAEYVLRDHPCIHSIFVTADFADRVKRIMQHEGVSENKAKEIAAKGDKKRKAYHDYYANSGWGVAETYDLCINSSRLGIEGSVEIIHRFIESRK